MNGAFQRRRTRIGILTIALSGLFVLAAIRLAMLVLIDGPRLASLARSEHTAEMTLAAVRGPIADRNGVALALSAETQSIYARPRRLLDTSDRAERARLAAAIGITARELEARLAHGGPFIWLGRHLAPAPAHTAEELGLDGVGAVNEYKRFYPESDLAGAVVGMAGTDGQGLSGIELQYDRMVRGAPVELRFYHDAFGHPIFDSPLELKNPAAGARLELTIDSSIQAEAEKYLAGQVRDSGAQRGVAVVLDPFTGEVLALANAARPGAPADRLHDAAVQDAFEPGSTMKGLLGAIALGDRVIDTRRPIFCENGEWHVGGRMIHDDTRKGWLNLGQIIEVSSNIGAAKIALALGANRFYQGLTAFGLGRKTGIDLPGEGNGLLRRSAGWRTIELADHGFGQGVAVTPIQLAVAYAAIANGGVVMRPYVVRAAYDADGHELLLHTPQALRRAIAPAVAHQMNLLLRGVVNGRDGTGHLAQVADYIVAGKTGTAQMINPATGAYYQSRLVASFVGFIPADDPRLVILVVLYDVPHGRFGGLYAAPAFSQIAAHAVARLDVAPHAVSYDTASIMPYGGGSGDLTIDPAADASSDDPVDGAASTARADTPMGYADVAASAPVEAGATPDFRGMSLRRALSVARANRVELEVNGSGYVMRQSPGPGRPLNRGPVRIALANDEIADTSQTYAGPVAPARHNLHKHAAGVSRVRSHQ
jgi:cell division protein FtsI (penicillin-binding protein 3)